MSPIGSRSPVVAFFLVLALTTSPSPRAGRAAEVRAESAKLLDAGVSAYNRGLYDEAVPPLERSAAVALNSFRAHHYLGLALSALRRHAEAVEALTVALDLKPDHLGTLIALGDARLALGDADEARAGYLQALKLRPAHAAALDGLARSYESQARDDEAVLTYRRAILADKGFAPAYTHLGDLYLRQNRLGLALRLMEEAVTIRPDYATGLNRLAAAYGALELASEGVAEVRKAIALEPSNPFHHETLARLELSQGLLGSAGESFRRALELEPRLPESRRGLAEIARREGDYDRALLEIASALAIPALDTLTSRQLAELGTIVEEERLALAGLEARVASGEEEPDDPAALAMILAGRGLWGEAAERQRRAPRSPAQREMLAYLLFQDGQCGEAHRIYAELADELGHVALRINDGAALALLGDDVAAARVFGDVLAQDPSQLLAQLYLGNALLRMRRPGEAATHYRAFLDAGGESKAAERVRRILKQIAPEMLPAEPESLLPEVPPFPPPDDVEEAG